MKRLFKMFLAMMLAVIMAVSFVSCTTSDVNSPAKVESKLKELGYEFVLFEDEEFIYGFWSDLEYISLQINMHCDVESPIAIGGIENEETTVILLWFKSGRETSKAEAYLVEFFREAKKASEENLIIYDVKDVDIVSKEKVVIIGYGKAFEDACNVIGVEL